MRRTRLFYFGFLGKGMRLPVLRRMSEAVSKAGGMSGPVTSQVSTEATKQSVFANLQRCLRWSPTSRQEIIDSEKRLLTLIQ